MPTVKEFNKSGLIYVDGDRDRKVLKAALDNFRMKEPLTVSEFGIKIYGECEDE